MPVDYKESEHSNLVLSEFHHIVGTAFFILSPMIFYFSGTGNSKWIAQQLAQAHQEPLVFIPDALRSKTTEFSLTENEKVGFVFPIYSWGPPPIVLQFIEQLVLHSFCGQYLFFVCSCGDDTGLTEQVLRKAFSARGWECNAGFSVTMPNNYVLLPGFDVDSKEVEQEKLRRAVPALAEINRLIGERKSLFRCHEGSMPFIKTRLINPLFTRYSISPKKFRATQACIACGRCEAACPVQNIVMVDGKPVWGANCTSCLACYHVCPKQAVQYGKQTQKKGQYFKG